MVCQPGMMRNREVEAHHRMHREHQRRRQSRQQQVGAFIALPVADRAAPSHRQDAVHRLGPRVACLVAHGRQVGNQADVPEDERNGAVGRDRKHVPHQRTAELRPDAHRVGIRKQPVGKPGTAKVQHRKHAGASHREQRHRLRKAVDGIAPALLQQQQNRRNQRARVADTDPPHEVDDGEAPGNRNRDAPDADAADKQVGGREQQHQRDMCRKNATPSDQPRVSGRRSTMLAILSVRLPNVCPGVSTGGCPGSNRSSCSVVSSGPSCILR